jgi:hypothetical protein
MQGWQLYNSDGKEFATELQTWSAGTTSGILTGSSLEAPPATETPAGDVQFGLMTMSSKERYTNLRITVTTVRTSMACSTNRYAKEPS